MLALPLYPLIQKMWSPQQSTADLTLPFIANTFFATEIFMARNDIPVTWEVEESYGFSG